MNDHLLAVQKALSLSYFFLKFRPRTEKEVCDYLHKKAEKFKLTEESIQEALQELKEEKYLDDDAFVRWFVDNRLRTKAVSAKVIKLELAKYGVSRDRIAAHFEDVAVDETALAQKALAKKWPVYRYLEKEKRFQKASGFLARKGFSFDIIKKTIAQFEKDGYNS